LSLLLAKSSKQVVWSIFDIFLPKLKNSITLFWRGPGRVEELNKIDKSIGYILYEEKND
jgi:hypothetical protein